MAKLPCESEKFLGTRLRELRLYFGYTQQEIANVLHVSRPAYNCYEQNRTRPDYTALGRLAVCYGLKVDAFYDGALKLDVALEDPKGKKRRVSRTGSDVQDVRKVGELRPVERSLILTLRSNGVIDATQMLNYLKTHLPQEQESEQEPEDEGPKKK